jgi:hypothetical protein
VLHWGGPAKSGADEHEMADQITAYVQNVSADTSYTVSVYDLFGGAARQVTGSPFALNPGDKSTGFMVYVDNAGVGMIRCSDAQGQQLCPDSQVTAGSPTVTFPA